MVNTDGRKSCLYIIETADKHIINDKAKIGIALDPEKRFNAIANTSPVRLFLFHYWTPLELNPLSAQAIEIAIKRRLNFEKRNAHNKSREWFDMPGYILEAHVVAVMDEVIARTEVDLEKERWNHNIATQIYQVGNGKSVFQMPSGRLVDQFGKPTRPSDTMKEYTKNPLKTDHELQQISP
jgi:hypothetical protein